MIPTPNSGLSIVGLDCLLGQFRALLKKRRSARQLTNLCVGKALAVDGSFSQLYKCTTDQFPYLAKSSERERELFIT